MEPRSARNMSSGELRDLIGGLSPGQARGMLLYLAGHAPEAFDQAYAMVKQAGDTGGTS